MAQQEDRRLSVFGCRTVVAVSVIKEYWSGVLQRLQAEVDVFSRLVRHAGEQGRENEVALQRVLAAFVPRRIGLGTGMVIDHLDHYSKQTDIILYDSADEPAIFAQTTQLIFTIETVLACIEVKTKLRSSDFEDCAKKIRALRQLDSSIKSDAPDQRPPYVLFAYDAEAAPDTISKTFHGLERDDRPDLAIIMRYGVLAGTRMLSSNLGDSFKTGVAVQRVDGEPTSPSDKANGVNDYLDGRTLPLVKVDGVEYVADPARALLLFVESLIRSISEQQGRTSPAFSNYIDDEARSLVWIPEPAS